MALPDILSQLETEAPAFRAQATGLATSPSDEESEQGEALLQALSDLESAAARLRCLLEP